MPNEPLDPWVEGYLDYLRDVRRKAPRSLIDARCTLRRVTRAMEAERPGVALWKLSLEDYLRWIERERVSGRSVRCTVKDLSHIRGLLNYAWRSGRSDRNVLDGFQVQDGAERVELRSLTFEEARRLIAALGRKTTEERRDRVMVLLLYGCGFRTGELCALDVGDIDREKQEVLVRRGKGDRQRTIPVPDGVWTELLAYLADRQGRRGPLFRTLAKRTRISSVDVCEVMGRVVKAAGLEGVVTAKTLRHTFATHLMDQGVDLAVIASLMGHRSPQETGVYLHALPGKRELAVRRLPSIGTEEEDAR